MIHGLTVIFLFLATVFAFVHQFAVATSLYWYYWWFDSVMHFWGGILLGLGFLSFSTFSRIGYRPTLGKLMLLLISVTILWEIFEWHAGLYNAETYWFDTIKDLLLGWIGGLLTFAFLRSRYNNKHE